MHCRCPDKVRHEIRFQFLTGKLRIICNHEVVSDVTKLILLTQQVNIGSVDMIVYEHCPIPGEHCIFFRGTFHIMFKTRHTCTYSCIGTSGKKLSKTPMRGFWQKNTVEDLYQCSCYDASSQLNSTPTLTREGEIWIIKTHLSTTGALVAVVRFLPLHVYVLTHKLFFMSNSFYLVYLRVCFDFLGKSEKGVGC